MLPSRQVVSHLHEETCTSTAYATSMKYTDDKLRSDWLFYHLLKNPDFCRKRLVLDGNKGLKMESTFLLGNFY